MPEYLFSYGTLQKEKVQMESFGRLLNGTNDVLTGYRLSPIEITDPAVLARSEQRLHTMAIKTGNENDMVEGVVYEVSNEELKQADDYEVSDVKRVKEKLLSGKHAWVYVEA